MENLEKISQILKTLSFKGKSISIAESCTGGYICHMFTNIPGSSQVFERGIVCYSNQSKIDLLNIDSKTIDRYGAVSESVAKQLAFNIRVLSNVDIGIGITGIAGPSGGTLEKPVGLVFIGYSTEKITKVQKHQFKVDRLTFKKKALEKILESLAKLI